MSSSEKKGTLTVFDLDDTLFICHAKLFVKKPDGTRVPVHSSATYRLQEGEEFDYSEFRSAQFFYDTAVPIDTMVRKFKAIRSMTVNPNSKIVIITARSDFDNKDLFMAALDKHGVAHDDVHVYRAGNLDHIDTTPQRKCHIIDSLFEQGNFEKIRMFEDSFVNLNAFLNMKANNPQYKDVKFEAWHVNNDGNVSSYFTV